jgi:hypothetical protein
MCEKIISSWAGKDPDDWYPPHSDYSLNEMNELGAMIREWIETARNANPNGQAGMYGPDWFPSGVDCYKSALFERIRSGLKPLPEPPPIGLACPWYAVVEDPGPHFVYDVKEAGQFGQWFEEHATRNKIDIFVLNNGYRVTEKRAAKDLIVQDARNNTSYRFHLWYDPEFTWPGRVREGYSLPVGGWLMQNVEFENA